MQDVNHSRRSLPASSTPGSILRRTLFGVFLVALLVVGGTGFRVWQVARADDRQPVDMLVVLGAAQYHGKPSAVLKARLEQALDLYESGMTRNIVTVGGRKSGDAYTEAEAGTKWLAEHGVPEDALIDVDEGSDTLGSIEAVGEVAEKRGWDTALIVSDPWHSWRARTMAADFGLEAWTSPTRSGPIVQTRETQLYYIFRETGALLFYRLTHAQAELSGDGLG